VDRTFTAKSAIRDLTSLSKPGKAADLQQFFKTAPGEYGEGDVFLGVMVPQTRQIAYEYSNLALLEIERLTSSEFHEARLCGLLILTQQFKKARDSNTKKSIFNFYMQQMKLNRINSWDLVDVTAPIIGQYLLDSTDPYKVLIKLAKSKNLWERRLAIIFTFAFIRIGEFGPTIAISELLLNDPHDLIHKGVGWALREVGKRDPSFLRSFLSAHVQVMPRTMLRYSIEKLSEKERRKWLSA